MFSNKYVQYCVAAIGGSVIVAAGVVVAEAAVRQMHVDNAPPVFEYPVEGVYQTSYDY